jgi:hypothetical protein
LLSASRLQGLDIKLDWLFRPCQEDHCIMVKASRLGAIARLTAVRH